MLDENKINRQVLYLFVPPLDPQEEYPKTESNSFRYFRARDGKKFILSHADLTSTKPNNNGVVEISDGHYETGWLVYPGVENNETLGRVEFDDNHMRHVIDFSGWEGKEITFAYRSTSESTQFRMCVILWYYQKTMTKLETFFYALVHPRFERFRKAFRTTVEPTED